MNWSNTSIYQYLSSMDSQPARDVKTLLDNPEVMPAIENILHSGGTSPKDFTLHDSQHSFRVAQQMWEIIPEETRNILSPYELGVLLMSAYLHDIGMSPDFELVRNHSDFLRGKKKALSEEQIDILQKWIYGDSGFGSLDVRLHSFTNEEQLQKCLAYFIRSQHNDWSGNWIADHLGKISLPNYPSWVTDVTLVCKSHHYGLPHLIGNQFDPKQINQHIVHLRYLAMALRIADILENDPERTPEIIFRHRSIDPQSVPYWRKDHYYNIERSEGRLSIYSRTPTATLQKAVIETANYIEKELRLCEELTQQKPLDHCGFRERLEGYRWILHPSLKRDIAPLEGSYTYIDGAFRPNTQRLLEILGGTQLYGEPNWAIRELIQNALDAVKEKIAHIQLNEGKTDDSYRKLLSQIHEVKVSIEDRESGKYLICQDNGVGMTKDIIEKFFLVSGTSSRYEIKDLERRCIQNNIQFERTGNFGIGVLSYFMIAHRLVVTTKRAQGTGYHDEELVGWRFELNGLHDFGELKKIPVNFVGTRIELELGTNFVNTFENFGKEIKDFISGFLIHSPCRVIISSEPDNPALELSAGWRPNADSVKSYFLQSYLNPGQFFPYENSKYQTYSERQNDIEAAEIRMRNSEKIGNSINFWTIEEEIPRKLRYQAIIPYFDLPDGAAFFRPGLINKDSYHRFGDLLHTFYVPNESIQLSWKGISIEASNDIEEIIEATTGNTPSFWANIDLLSSNLGEVGASRVNIDLDESKIIPIIELIRTKVRELICSKENALSREAATHTRQFISNIIPPKFKLPSKTPDSDFTEFHIPLLLNPPYYAGSNKFVYKSKQINALPEFASFFLRTSHSQNPQFWNDFHLRLCRYESTDLSTTRPWNTLAVVADRYEPNASMKPDQGYSLCQFPKFEITIFAAMVSTPTGPNSLVLNESFPNIGDINSSFIAQMDEIDEIDADVAGQSKSNAISSLISIFKRQMKIWDWLVENKIDLIQSIFSTIEIDEVLVLNDRTFEIIRYTPTGTQELTHENSEATKFLNAFDDDFTLYVS